MSEGDRSRSPVPLPAPKAPETTTAVPTVSEFTKAKPPSVIFQEQEVAAQQQLIVLRQQMTQEALTSVQKIRGSQVVVYYSRNMVSDEEVSGFYQVFAGVDKIKKLDLLLFSHGGFSDDAYKMASLCREHCDALGVLIAYKAKSAATILALAADELVMGRAAEIGPIDPQVPVLFPDGNQYFAPAQSIREGLEFLEGRVKANQECAQLYQLLVQQVNPLVLGALERANKSAVQYAETLLLKYGLLTDKAKAKDIAAQLVTGYYSHGFVIDRKVAKEELKLNVSFPTQELEEKLWLLHSLYMLEFQRNARLGSIIQTANSLVQVPLKTRPTGARQEVFSAE